MTKAKMKAFFDALEGKLGCNFREDEAGKIVWTCAGGNDKTLSRKILTMMKIPPALAEDFLEICHQHGGHCDCQIIFNAKERLLSRLLASELESRN